MEFTKSVQFCIMLCFVYFKGASSLKVAVFKSAEKAVLGDNPFTLSCTYTFSSNSEQLFFIELKRKREGESDFVTIVIFQNPSSPLNARYAPTETSLESRTVASNPTVDSRTATLVFNQIDCDDKATYRWHALYKDGQNKMVDEDLSFVVKANPLLSQDGSVTLSQNTSIEKGDKVVFTCSGDVGNEPVGHLRWFYYLNNDTSLAINASSVAQETSPVYQSSTCSYRRTSTLELTMTSTFHNILVRCTVQQDKFDHVGNGYVQTNNIPVLYERDDKSTVIPLAVDSVLSITAGLAVAVLVVAISVYCVKRKKKSNQAIPEGAHTERNTNRKVLPLPSEQRV